MKFEICKRSAEQLALFIRLLRRKHDPAQLVSWNCGRVNCIPSTFHANRSRLRRARALLDLLAQLQSPYLCVDRQTLAPLLPQLAARREVC